MSIFLQGYGNTKEILEVKCPYSIRGMKEILKFKAEFLPCHDKVSIELMKPYLSNSNIILKT